MQVHEIASSEENDTIWIPPIHKTVSTEGKGIPELAESIAKHVAHLRQSGDWAARDRARLGSELDALLRESLMSQFLRSTQGQYREVVGKVLRRELSPYEAVKSLLNGKTGP
jgi:LAO/AO transport system kinase